jgi:DNA-binding SARP family transcriptional activator
MAVRVPRSAARLLAAVGLLGPVSRSQAAGLLWPDGTQGQAMANLRTALSRLGLIDGGFVLAAGDVLELRDGVHLDVWEVMAWVNASIYGTTPPVDGLRPPPVEVGKELLAGWSDDWLAEWRERLRILQTQALETVAEGLVAVNRCAEALPYALSAVQAQPWSESANKIVIEIHARRGNPSSALQQFYQFRSALRRELGVEPGSDIVATMRHLYPFGTGTARAAAERT